MCITKIKALLKILVTTTHRQIKQKTESTVIFWQTLTAVRVRNNDGQIGIRRSQFSYNKHNPAIYIPLVADNLSRNKLPSIIHKGGQVTGVRNSALNYVHIFIYKCSYIYVWKRKTLIVCLYSLFWKHYVVPLDSKGYFCCVEVMKWYRLSVYYSCVLVGLYLIFWMKWSSSA